jgi:hypothetical protein
MKNEEDVATAPRSETTPSSPPRVEKRLNLRRDVVRVMRARTSIRAGGCGISGGSGVDGTDVTRCPCTSKVSW